jgi:hypothetical protein
VPLVAVQCDAAYGARNGDFGLDADPGFEVPGGTIEWRASGAGHGVVLTIYGLGYPAMVKLYERAAILNSNWHADVVELYAGDHGEWPPHSSSWPCYVRLMEDGAKFLPGSEAFQALAEVSAWADALQPAVGDVRRGVTFGEGGGKVGTLVVARRSC